MKKDKKSAAGSRHKILIFGSAGMLGSALVKTLSHHEIYPLTRKDIDVTSRKSVLEAVSQIKPDFVINSTAYNEVDAAESKTGSKEAFDVNAKAVGHIADACKKYGCTLIHISTDFVFGGKKKGYKEDSKTNPINTYGKSKEKGEKLILSRLKNKRYYLIRTSWLFGKHGENFVEAILRNANGGRELKIVNDQFGSPTYTNDLAESIKSIIGSKMPFGIYHATNTGTCTWHDFAKKIVEFARLKNKVIPITARQLGRAAIRPKYSVLLNTKLPRLRSWEDALKEYLKER